MVIHFLLLLACLAPAYSLNDWMKKMWENILPVLWWLGGQWADFFGSDVIFSLMW